jgi:hypothetical protein
MTLDQETFTRFQGLFEHLKTVLDSPDFQARHRRHPQDFTRPRRLTFSIVVCILLNLLKRALQDELDEFFKVLDATPVALRLVTKSAFCQARLKLRYEALVELNRVQVRYFYEHFQPLRWQGFRLLAVDGSMSELPPQADLGAHFGVWHPAAGGSCPKARLSQLFDPLNRVTVDALILPKDVGEREAAARHCAQLQPTDLVLLDRGYPAVWLLLLIRSTGAHFCLRFKLSGWQIVETFLATGQREQIVTMAPPASARPECQAHGLTPAPLPLRLIRIELDNGQVEVLGTSLLDQSQHPYALFKDLYHDRWPVEEDYKALKCRVEVENWSGTSVLTIYQDFHAKVFTKNLTALLAFPVITQVAQQGQAKQHVYRPNMTHALSKTKDTVVLLLTRAHSAPLLKPLWMLISHTLEPVRPNRSYSRKTRVKPRKFAMNYKPVR